MVKLKVNGGWWQFTDPLAGREAFVTHGALSGHPHSLFEGDNWGSLPEHYRRSYFESVYAVYSYATPIAWLGEDGVWIMPGIKYSMTTSKHQGKIFTAIGQL